MEGSVKRCSQCCSHEGLIEDCKLRLVAAAPDEEHLARQFSIPGPCCTLPNHLTKDCQSRRNLHNVQRDILHAQLQAGNIRRWTAAAWQFLKIMREHS